MGDLMDDDELDAILAKAQADMERRTLMNWWIRRQMRITRAYVDHDVPLARRMEWSQFAMLMLSLLTCITVGLLIRGGPWLVSILAIAVVAWQGSRTAVSTKNQADAFRQGWFAGRRHMIAAYEEARRRGIDDRQWVTAMYERDAQVLW